MNTPDATGSAPPGGPRAQRGAAHETTWALTSQTLRSPRHTTHYWQAGPVDGPLMIFLHGWPEIGLMWRAQVDAFAAEGWRCVAPDMRGYGGSSAPTAPDSYALEELVADMVELHNHLGARPAIWVGHDLGSPVAGALAAHYRERARGVVLISVPYFPESFALPTLLPLIDRNVYPTDRYPDGQWDYYRFYLTDFDQSVRDFEADIPATLAAIYQRGTPSAAGEPSPSAAVTLNGGWFGPTHRAPAVPADPTLWPDPDFDALVKAFRTNGFRPANAWYLNDTANIAYARIAADDGQLHMPVLFINSDRDPICDITGNQLGEPMRQACHDLTVTSLPAGHWVPLECKTDVIDAIRSWLPR